MSNASDEAPTYNLPQTDPTAVHLAYAGDDITICLLRGREATTDIDDVTCNSCQDEWARIMQAGADADAALAAVVEIW